jgi:hypothetical protein
MITCVGPGCVMITYRMLRFVMISAAGHELRHDRAAGHA